VDRLEKDFCETLQFLAPWSPTARPRSTSPILPWGSDHQTRSSCGVCLPGAANIAILCGAAPVFVEVDSATWCLDARSSRIGRSPAHEGGSFPIHTYGNVCDLTAISRSPVAGYPVVKTSPNRLMFEWEGRQAERSVDRTYSFHCDQDHHTGEGGMV